MPKAKEPSSPANASSASGRKGRKSEAAFDVWLQKGLHEIYDKVASEPIPDELLRLIEEDRKK